MQHRLIIIALLVFAPLALAWSCAEVSTQEDIMLPSDLARDPQKYDGKHVVLRGYVVVTPESRNIFDSSDGVKNPRGACLGLDGEEKLFSKPRQHSVGRLSGVFKRNLCAENEYCPFWCYTAGVKSGLVLDSDAKP